MYDDLNALQGIVVYKFGNRCVVKGSKVSKNAVSGGRGDANGAFHARLVMPCDKAGKLEIASAVEGPDDLPGFAR